MSDISILLKVSERCHGWIQIGEGAEYRNIQLSNTFYTYGSPTSSWTEMAYLWKTVASHMRPLGLNPVPISSTNS